MPKPQPKPLPTPSADMVDLETIVVDQRWQVRKHLDHSAVVRYAAAMEAGAEFPPVKLAKVNGALVLVSGFHRVGAAKLARKSAVLAEVYEARPQTLLWLAAEENLKHGLPMKASEHRKVFMAYVNAGRHRTDRDAVKSSRTIAADLNGIVSHATVLRWMRSDFPSVFRKMSGEHERPANDGGVQELPQLSDEAVVLASALEALGQLRAAVAGITSPEARGQLIGPLKSVLLALDEATATDPDF